MRALIRRARDSGPGRRAAERARIGLPAQLETVTGTRAVTLQNLSVAGAMIEAKNLPRVGQDVVVKCGGIDALAIVVWAGSGRCGLAFDSIADGEEIMRLRDAGQEAVRNEQSPDAVAAANDWANGSMR